MIKVSTNKELKEAISLLEERQSIQAQLLKNRLISATEGMRPANIMKNIVSRMTASPDLKGGIITTAIGLAVFYLTRKTIWRAGRNPLRKILSSLLQLGVSNVMVRNPRAIRYMGRAVFDGIFHKKKKQGIDASDHETC